ncbi:TetR/AcrR family transcriptional regulator [Streptomyces sp. AM 2-1-1]|uniref:TetR/AcrR family transcriptional regulator n=1 Tax=Streptomyces sp. AM 2-1-1 TaxID=3028709 RepID=UPI0023BA2A7A|nr:TetR/AcrR family transcriptional regulator [Streptomyces sp. AM 2-1-1]WEH41697.1 TetR/AcrR family transcriptional regulator [Streptomyces sp. AM 2-1-1]
MADGASTPRERYRQQIRAEVKECAREQIATAGASGLSLNAIAKRMGMSGPALYRYFAGRDELITELVRDAYRSLADAFVAAGEEAGPAGLAEVLRRWALEDPHRYFLVYGTPVPGYEAPEDVTAIAGEMMTVLLGACAAAAVSAAAGPDFHAFEADLAAHHAWAGAHPDTPPAALRLALALWTRLHGVLSLELAGHFTGMGLDPALMYAAEVEALTAGE